MATYSADLMGGKDGKSWLLIHFKRGGEGAQKIKEARDGNSLPWQLCYNIPMGWWVRDPSFVITRAGPAPGSDGDSQVRIHFRYDVSKRQWKDAPTNVPSGHIDLDAAHSYRIMAYEFVVKSEMADGVARGTLEYEGGDGLPVLKTKVEEEPGFQSQKLGPYSSKDI